MTFDFKILPIIEKKIKETEKEYQKTQGLILTESDLKCLLYKKLNAIPELSRITRTEDQHIYANFIHTELPWYDQNKKLTIKPDITILEPRNLSILHKCYEPDSNPPSKQCEFHGKAIIFELKFIRNKTGIRKATLDRSIKQDFKKIERLFRRLEHQNKAHEVFCYFVIFNKTDIKCKEFKRFLNLNVGSNRYKVIYGTGKINFAN